MELQSVQDYEYINGRKVLKKHVATIHCSNKLSLLERKISNALLFHAFPKLKEQLIHEITIDQLKRLLGANTRNHQALKDALKTLISTVIEWNLLGDSIPEMELEGWSASTILSSVSVKKGVIKYQYSELIKTLMIDPTVYGKINLVIQSRFKSAYALALYENCARYRGLAYTKNIDMLIFRKLMGVEEGKYEIFRDFNRRVLNPAVTEINTCSDIRVLPEIVRRGRKVQSIKFKIEERPIKQRIGIQSSAEEITLGDDFSMSQEALSSLIKQHGQSRVHQAADYIRSLSAYQKGEIRNMPGYLKSAVENQYEKKSAKKKQSELSKDQQIEIQWRLHKHDYLRTITNDMIDLFSKLPDEEQRELVAALQSRGKQLLGNDIEMLLGVYYAALGDTDDRIARAIAAGNCHVNAFFESGFSEFLLKSRSYFSEHVMGFNSYLEKQQ